MDTSIRDTTDSGVNQIVETIIAALQKADEQGLRFLPVHQLWRDNYGKWFRVALRTAQDSGRIVTRRVHAGGGRRRRFVALPKNQGFLPGGAQ